MIIFNALIMILIALTIASLVRIHVAHKVIKDQRDWVKRQQELRELHQLQDFDKM